MALIPPTLVRMEAPTLVDGPADLAATVARRGNGGAKAGGNDPVMEDVVNSILPPRMWSQPDGTTWMQYASKEPASRLDVLSLQDALDERLAQRQARDTGICPVREDLYRQCYGESGAKQRRPPSLLVAAARTHSFSLFSCIFFPPADELIRQVTLDSPERGLLLLRVRDEIRLTLDAYRTLYDSSVTFGIRKQMQAELGMPELETEIGELSERKRTLEAQVLALRNKIEVVERRQVGIIILLRSGIGRLAGCCACFAAHDHVLLLLLLACLFVVAGGASAVGGQAKAGGSGLPQAPGKAPRPLPQGHAQAVKRTRRSGRQGSTSTL